MQEGLPKTGETGFLLGVADNRLLLDGTPLETGQAERSFAQLLTAAGLASIHFSTKVTLDDFTRLVTAFAMGGSKAQDFAKQLKETLGDNKHSSIKINEVKFVAADPATQGASSGGSGEPGGAPLGTVPNIPVAHGGGAGTGGGGGAWSGGTVPLQEEEVIQAIRMLTHFGQAAQDPNANPEELMKAEFIKAPEGAKLNLAALLESLSKQVTTTAEQTDTPLLMKAAEHMAIRFALDRYQKGEVKVNAVHQMMEHMSRQMDTLRQILRVQEDKMSKAGMLVEAHADMLDRMFWAELPESSKKRALLSEDAACVPARNVRQYVELLLQRSDRETASAILTNYANAVSGADPEYRTKVAAGLPQLADLFERPERFTSLANDLDVVKRFVRDHVAG